MNINIFKPEYFLSKQTDKLLYKDLLNGNKNKSINEVLTNEEKTLYDAIKNNDKIRLINSSISEAYKNNFILSP